MINDDNSDIELLINTNKTQQAVLENELNKTTLQLNNLYDLLEQGIYSKEIFIERFNAIKNKITEINNKQKLLKEEYHKIVSSKNKKEIIIPKIENVIDTYETSKDIVLKNKLLKDVLQKVEYLKINPNNKEDFKLKLFLKLY